MTAKEKFKKGDRVRLSKKAVDQGFREGLSQTGVVVGFGRQPHLVRVRIDGTKTEESWGMDYWEKE